MMFNYILLAIFFCFSCFSPSTAVAISDVDKQELTKINLIKNGGIENGLAGFTAYAGGALTVETTLVRSGKKSLKFTGANGSYFETSLSSIPDGSDIFYSFYYITTSSLGFKVEIYDQTNTYTSPTIQALVSCATYCSSTPKTFPLVSGKKYKYRFTNISGGAATLYIDDLLFVDSSEIIGSGTTNQVAVFSDSKKISGNTSLSFDPSLKTLTLDNILSLKGSTSGYTSLKSPATAGSYSLTLPATVGSSGQVLSGDGSGNLQWASAMTSSLTSGKILVGDVSNNASQVLMAGQATMTNLGAVTLDNDSVINKSLTGYVYDLSGTPISATDTIKTAIQKIDGKVTSSNPISSVLTGYTIDPSGTPVSATDTIKSAIQKIDGTVSNLSSMTKWMTGHSYSLGNIIYEPVNNKIFKCIVAHTSGVFMTDLIAGDWEGLKSNDDAAGEFKNFVANPNGSQDTSSWVTNNLTLSRSLVNKIGNISSLAISGATNVATACTDAIILDSDVTGTCEYSASVVGDGSLWKLALQDGSGNELSSVALSNSGSAFQSYYNIFPCTSGAKVCLVSTGASPASVSFGKVYYGKAKHITNVSQAQFVGSARWIATGDCSWLTNNSSYSTTSNFSANSSCNDPVVTGNVSKPTTKIPAIILNNIPAGHCEVKATGWFGAAATINKACIFGFTDGTTVSSKNPIYNEANIGENRNTILGSFDYTTPQVNKTISLTSARVVSDSGLCGIINGISVAGGFYPYDLDISVICYPSSSQLAITNDQSSWFVDANIGGSNPNYSGGIFGEVTDSSLDLVNNTSNGSANDVKIACANGNASTGLICSSSNESVGLCFTNPFAGVFDCGIEFSISNNSNGSEFKLVETSDLSSSLVQTGSSRVSVSGNYTGNAPISLKSIFLFSDIKKRCVRLYSNSSNLKFLTDRSGERDFHISCKPFLQNVAPVIDPKIAVRYTLSNPSGGILNFTTKDFETISGLVTNPTTNWKFTAPINGVYVVGVYLAAGANIGVNPVTLSVTGSSSYIQYIAKASDQNNPEWNINGTGIVNLKAGDSVQLSLGGGSVGFNDSWVYIYKL